MAGRLDTTRVTTGVAWLVLYVGSTVALTWPLAAHLGTHLAYSETPCGFDLLHIGWSLAHQSASLWEGGAGFADGGIYYPEPASLFYGQTAMGALPIFAPVYWATGNPTLALNVVFLLGLALTAAALHFVVERLTASHAAGFVAAWTFLLCRWTLWTFVPTVPNYALLFLFPLILLRLCRPVSSAGECVGLAVLIWAQCLPDVAYLATSLFGAVGGFALLEIVRSRTRVSGGWTLLALLLAALALAPIHYQYLQLSFGNPDLASQTRWVGLGQAPTSLPWGLLRETIHATSVPSLAIPLVVVGGLLSAFAWRRDGSTPVSRAWRVSAVFVVMGTLLCLTPEVELFGRRVRLPLHGFAESLGVYERLRVPARLTISALIGLSVMAGLSAHAISRFASAWAPGLGARRASAGIAAIVALAWVGQAVFGWDPIARPLPRLKPLAYPILQPPGPDSSLVRLLKQGEGPVLEVPMRPRRPRGEALAMYRSIFHGRPLLNGYNGYWPAEYAARAEIADRLPAVEALGRLQREAHVEHVVVHPVRLEPAHAARWRRLAQAPAEGLVFEGRSDDSPAGALVFRAVRP